MDRGKQKSGDEGEMIDKKSELSLIAGPMRRSVKGKGKKQHIGGSQYRALRKECPVNKAKASALSKKAAIQASATDMGKPAAAI
jgi:hypothetical protein